MNAFRLYRFTHADGTAKEWAYRDLGDGTAEIRWGPASRLRQAQVKPSAVARARAKEKLRKGYQDVGTVWLDRHGNRAIGPKPLPKPSQPVDLSTLLGGGEGFYF